MLTEKRIKELADMAFMRNDAEAAIRLAVAETAEACVEKCLEVRHRHQKNGRPGAFWVADECVESIRAAAKGAK